MYIYSLVITTFLSVLFSPAFSMEREVTKTDNQIALERLLETRAKLAHIVPISISPSDSGSNLADPNSMAYKRQSLGHTKQEIWGSTILVGVFLCEKGNEKLKTLPSIEASIAKTMEAQTNLYACFEAIIKKDSDYEILKSELQRKECALLQCMQLSILNEAEGEYIKAANLYIQGYVNGYQKESLRYICEALDPLLDIEQQKLKIVQTQTQDYKTHKYVPSLQEKLNNLIVSESERIRLKKANRGSRTFSIPTAETTAITKLNDQTQRINNRLIFAQALIGFAKACNSTPSYENCMQCKKLCYAAILSFFNVYELNKNEEVLNSIDDVLKIIANSDNWIYNFAKDQWEADKKMNNVITKLSKLRADLNLAKDLKDIKEIKLATNVCPPKPQTSPREAECRWEEFLYVTQEDQKKTPERKESPRKSGDTPERTRSRSGSGSGTALKKAGETLSTLTKIFKKP